MKKTGDARWVWAAALLVASTAGAADLEFYQTVDRAELGTEDTLQLAVVTVNAPDGAQLRLPDLSPFEVLSNTPVRQKSIQVSGSGMRVQEVSKQVLTLRPSRAGTFTIGPSTLQIGGETRKTDSIQVTVRQGRVADPYATGHRPRNPFRDFFGGRFPGYPDDPFDSFPDMEVPTSDSDLFIRTTVDKRTAFIGEQITLSVYVFSRIELSSVDTVTFPSFAGFWAEDLESPSQLAGEQRVLNGVPYRAYLLKRKALFPTKGGKLEIDPVQADVTTGYLFAGRRVHRLGNRVSVTVKPLPPGAPPGFSSAHVGQWELSREVSPSPVKLGEPLTVKVIVSGRGNVKNVAPPKLVVPPSFRVYDPTTADEVKPRGGKLGGRRVEEYLVMPSQTGKFTLPEMSFAYFDPESESYAIARAPALTIQVEPGAASVASAAGLTAPSVPGDPQAAKNVLTADGLRPLRHEADFGRTREPVWARGWFLPAVLSPVGLWIALGALGLVRDRVGREEPQARRKRQARAARRRLEAAERLRQSDNAEAFYAEVHSALIHFLEARLGEPVGGLTRDALDERLRAHGASEDARRRVAAVLEACEQGRFAPRVSADADRELRSTVLEDAATAMEALDAR